ncbi:ABC transporter permease [Litoreibacter roseus]|uniref:Membrane protein n=1 Tax=Litoreibacter roseus TaxID=2601869 RepID=A0A6N6JFP2_9RHOB|nr:ABC transporter permease [Litoreibacter roseus]GFE64955.1 membrane protein [Litoreibacter roseus]
MVDLWHSLSAPLQDSLLLIALLAPLGLLGWITIAGFSPLPLVRAILWRFRWANALFVSLIAVSVGLGVGILAQERGLRVGTATAADKFDLIIAAPGSELTMLMAAVYLQPSNVGLVDGQVYTRIAEDPLVDLAAPLAFGDSYKGAPVIGTISEFVAHLSGTLAEGEIWQTYDHAVIGADVPLSIGEKFEPAHGFGFAVQEGVHGHQLTVMGVMQPTGSPWDRAILVPIEAVWETHGMFTGHAPEDNDHTDRFGPPFDADFFPGTPAVVVRAQSLAAAYTLQSTFARDGETMAFFPGAVLAGLYNVMGDVRQAMSLMASVTQILVAASVLMGLFILSQLFQRQMALLQALGAPRRFVLSVVWLYATVLTIAGALFGLVVGFVSALVLSEVVSDRTGINVTAQIGWGEVHLIAAFVLGVSVLSLVPGIAVLRRDIATSLRS